MALIIKGYSGFAGAIHVCSPQDAKRPAVRRRAGKENAELVKRRVYTASATH